MNAISRILAVSAAFFLTSQSWAHGVPMPQHGGIVDDAGLVAVELVAKDNAADLYLTDDDAPVDAQNVRGVLTVTGPDGKQQTTVTPLSGNQLHAKGVTVKPGTKVTALLTMADGVTKVSARFTVR